jgi:hypothetical protein
MSKWASGTAGFAGDAPSFAGVVSVGFAEPGLVEPASDFATVGLAHVAQIKRLQKASCEAYAEADRPLRTARSAWRRTLLLSYRPREFT